MNKSRTQQCLIQKFDFHRLVCVFDSSRIYHCLQAAKQKKAMEGIVRNRNLLNVIVHNLTNKDLFKCQERATISRPLHLKYKAQSSKFS